MIFFTDENLSEYLARMIGLFDRVNVITPHCDKFDKGTPDETWIRAVAAWQEKPIVILGDGRILRNPALRVIARESGLSFVVMGESFMRTRWEDQAWKFVKVWPDIRKAVTGLHKPTIFDVGITSLKVQARLATADLK